MYYQGEKRLQLDLGCGGNKQKGFIGMDLRALPGVDIVHDIEVFPWPLESGCCQTVVASHLVEHIKPWYSIPFMDECWRVLQEGGKLLIATPYPGSRGFWQDPTHCNGWSEATFQYFDPRYPLYGIYQPKPWEIKKGFPVYQSNGNLEVILTKVSEEQQREREETQRALQAGATLGISVADDAKLADKMGG